MFASKGQKEEEKFDLAQGHESSYAKMEGMMGQVGTEGGGEGCCVACAMERVFTEGRRGALTIFCGITWGTAREKESKADGLARDVKPKL